jgi:beta-xylosidase
MKPALSLLLRTLVISISLSMVVACENLPQQGHVVPKPLYRDAVFDGAADPLVIWNQLRQKWFMFYTNRRANVAGLQGVEWVHGTPIGIAESIDGAHWQYLQDADIHYPVNQTSVNPPTYWAPDVLYARGQYHMFLTIVPGVFQDWKHPRSLVHFTSKDLLNWDFAQSLKLNSDRVIDADVIELPQGGYRLFYNDEPDGKSVYYADSSDLFNWQDQGKLAIQSRGEGPTAFQWHGYWWLVVDAWQGLSVYRSEDLVTWDAQPHRLLEKPGTGVDDGVIGGHPDVVVNDGKAYLFYFTHPGRTPENQGIDDYSTRRSSIQLTELQFNDGWLFCNRDSETIIDLRKPILQH